MLILNVFRREFVGWQVTKHVWESLVRDALTMASATKYRAREDVSRRAHHSDRWVQDGLYLSFQHSDFEEW